MMEVDQDNSEDLCSKNSTGGGNDRSNSGVGNLEDSERETASKRAKRLPKCIIHSSKDDPTAGSLISPKDLASWNTLLNAAKIRKHTAILNVEETRPEGEVPVIFYHKQCRCIFTLKKTLDSLVEKDEHGMEASSGEVNRKSSRSTLVSSRPVYDAKCIFCEKKTKYFKGLRSREPLVMCSVLDSDQTVRKIATQRMDGRILAALSRELVAAEGQYHRSCYRDYTRYKDKSTERNVQESEHDDDDEYHRIESQAYDKLFDFIRENLMEHPKVIKMTDLVKMLVSSMTATGVNEIKLSTKKHIRRKLEVEFGDTLSICADQNGRLLVFPYNLSINQLAIENQRLHQELDIINSSNSDKESGLRQAAFYLRQTIKDQESNLSWPPQPSELTDASENIPPSISHFLYWLLTGDGSSSIPTARVQRLINSFGQDLVYAVSCGRQKTAKHILLASAIKSLTNNVELIKILNRLGHCVSYTKIEEIDTALCLQKLASTPHECATLPNDIYPHIPTTVAWDNIDRIEETLSGAGTSHRVNGIIVQPKCAGPIPQLHNTIVIPQHKQRCIEPQDEHIPVYNAGERTGPLPRQYIDITNAEVMKDAQARNLLWLLARLHSSSRQTISGWTGFNIRYEMRRQ